MKLCCCTCVKGYTPFQEGGRDTGSSGACRGRAPPLLQMALCMTSHPSTPPSKAKSHSLLVLTSIGTGSESSPSLGKILSFWTGLEDIPPHAYSEYNLTVDFLEGDKKFPTSQACFFVLKYQQYTKQKKSFFIIWTKAFWEARSTLELFSYLKT